MGNAVEFHEGITASNNAFMTAFNQGDAAGVAALYTESGKVMASNMDFMIGKQAVQEVFQTLMDMGIKGVNLETVEVEEYGDTASEVGKYTLRSGEGEVLDQGKYLVIWKNEDDQWKLHRDMFNSSMPPA